MKKHLLISLLLLLISFGNSNAQCVPNIPGPEGSISPDTIQNLDTAYTGIMYTAEIQVYIPADTFGFQIDSLQLDSITGLPATFSYSTTPASGVFPGNSAACIQFKSANPPFAAMGTHRLTLHVKGYSLVTLPMPIPGYKIVILQGTGIGDNDNSDFQVFQNMPNPFSGVSEIQYRLKNNTEIYFSVYNSMGALVVQKTLDGKQGLNSVKLNSAEFASGVYLYKISNGTEFVTRRMIVN